MCDLVAAIVVEIGIRTIRRNDNNTSPVPVVGYKGGATIDKTVAELLAIAARLIERQHVFDQRPL
jgi:hypothetical protein